MRVAKLARTAASPEHPLDELLDKGVKRCLCSQHTCAERRMTRPCHSGDRS